MNEDSMNELIKLVNEELDENSASHRESLSSVNLQVNDIQSRLDSLYETIEMKDFRLEDLKPRILKHKSNPEMLMAGKEDLEAQLNQGGIPDIDLGILRAYIDNFLWLIEDGTIY